MLPCLALYCTRLVIQELMSTLPVTHIWKLTIGWAVIKRIVQALEHCPWPGGGFAIGNTANILHICRLELCWRQPFKDGAQSKSLLPLLGQYWHVSYFLISGTTRVSSHRVFVGLCWRQSENRVYMTWCPPKNWFPVSLGWFSSCLGGTRASRGLSQQPLRQSDTPVAQ